MLDRTPFYAESGGQNADAGTITWDGGQRRGARRPAPGRGPRRPPGPGARRRADARRHRRGCRSTPSGALGARQAHSGTHVVHAALREVLGPTALQSGSYNRPGYLRLDFGWTGGAVAASSCATSRRSPTARCARTSRSSAKVMPLTEAKEIGALALFGETYGEDVRVVEIGGPWSRELCGGTHVERSSQIGTVVLTSDSSVGAGNRRVEALVGLEGFRVPRPRARPRPAAHRPCSRRAPTDVPGPGPEAASTGSQPTEKELEQLKAAELVGAAADLAAAGRRRRRRRLRAAIAPRASAAATSDRSRSTCADGCRTGRPWSSSSAPADGKPSAVVARQRAGARSRARRQRAHRRHRRAHRRAWRRQGRRRTRRRHRRRRHRRRLSPPSRRGSRGR